MTNCNCGNRIGCSALAIIAGLIIGIVTAILNFTAIIAVTPAFLWVTLGIAVVYLAVLLLASAIRPTGGRNCVCSALQVVLIGILGTVLTSIILLAITFAATSVLGAIIVGALLLFFTFVITGTACLIKCIFGCDFED